MDFDSGWGDDEDGGDSWGDDGDDEDWKRKKREAVKVKKEKKKVEEENKRIRREVETALFPKEENKRMRREVEGVENKAKKNFPEIVIQVRVTKIKGEKLSLKI